jgi:glucosyl-3-phosphoglycerate synthase
MDQTPWTLSAGDYSLERVTALKAGHAVSVIVPARDEAATVGGVLDAIFTHPELVDEVVVVDDGSADDTATVAARHGARVVTGSGKEGKGGAMATGLAATTGDLVVFLDADVENMTTEYVGRLLQPLLERPAIQLVKGYYERPLHHLPSGGGRVNELAARPILSLLYPGLGEVRQPLAGETAGRRSAFTALTLEPNYAVEIALVIDIATSFGVSAIAQVDLGVRRHRNRPIEELRPMALEVVRTALSRRGLHWSS